jgi:hypothetical protein
MFIIANYSDTKRREAQRSRDWPLCSMCCWIFGYPAFDEGTRSHLMEGFVALAVFAKQMFDSQKETPSTQHNQDRPSPNRGELVLLNDTGLNHGSEPLPDPS